MPTRQDLVTALAAEVLDSFEKLDVILALDDSPAPVALDDLVRKLRLDRDLIVEAVGDLASDGVVERASDAHAIARGGPWAEHVGALASLYRDDRTTVVTIMSQAAVRRLRRRAERAFAEAFVIRSKKGDRDG